MIEIKNIKDYIKSNKKGFFSRLLLRLTGNRRDEQDARLLSELNRFCKDKKFKNLQLNESQEGELCRIFLGVNKIKDSKLFTQQVNAALEHARIEVGRNVSGDVLVVQNLALVERKRLLQSLCAASRLSPQLLHIITDWFMLPWNRESDRRFLTAMQEILDEKNANKAEIDEIFAQSNPSFAAHIYTILHKYHVFTKERWQSLLRCQNLESIENAMTLMDKPEYLKIIAWDVLVDALIQHPQPVIFVRALREYSDQTRRPALLPVSGEVVNLLFHYDRKNIKDMVSALCCMGVEIYKYPDFVLDELLMQQHPDQFGQLIFYMRTNKIEITRERMRLVRQAQQGVLLNSFLKALNSPLTFVPRNEKLFDMVMHSAAPEVFVAWINKLQINADDPQAKLIHSLRQISALWNLREGLHSEEMQLFNDKIQQLDGFSGARIDNIREALGILDFHIRERRECVESIFKHPQAVDFAKGLNYLRGAGVEMSTAFYILFEHHAKPYELAMAVVALRRLGLKAKEPLLFQDADPSVLLDKLRRENQQKSPSIADGIFKAKTTPIAVSQHLLPSPPTQPSSGAGF